MSQSERPKRTKKEKKAKMEEDACIEAAENRARILACKPGDLVACSGKQRRTRWPFVFFVRIKTVDDGIAQCRVCERGTEGSAEWTPGEGEGEEYVTDHYVYPGVETDEGASIELPTGKVIISDGLVKKFALSDPMCTAICADEDQWSQPCRVSMKVYHRYIEAEDRRADLLGKRPDHADQ